MSFFQKHPRTPKSFFRCIRLGMLMAGLFFLFASQTFSQVYHHLVEDAIIIQDLQNKRYRNFGLDASVAELEEQLADIEKFIEVVGKYDTMAVGHRADSVYNEFIGANVVIIRTRQDYDSGRVDSVMFIQDSARICSLTISGGRLNIYPFNCVRLDFRIPINAHPTPFTVRRKYPHVIARIQEQLSANFYFANSRSQVQFPTASIQSLNTELDAVQKKNALLERFAARLAQLEFYNTNKPVVLTIFDTEVVAPLVTKFEHTLQGIPDGLSNNLVNVEKTAFALGGAAQFSTIVEGFAEFLEERIKEELFLFVYENIQKELSKPPYPGDPLQEVKALLPATCAYINGLDQENITSNLDPLKDAIQRDFNNLVKNLPKLKDLPRYQALIAEYPELEFVFVGLELLNQISEASHPVDVLTWLSDHEVFQNAWADTSLTYHNLHAGLQLVATMAYGLTVHDGKSISWVNPDYLDDYLTHDRFIWKWLGLMAKQDQTTTEITFLTTPTTTTPVPAANLLNWYQLVTDFYQNANAAAAIANDYVDSVEEFEELINDFLGITKNINGQILEIKRKKANGEKAGYETHLQLYNSFIELIRFSPRFVDWYDSLPPLPGGMARAGEVRIPELPPGFDSIVHLQVDRWTRVAEATGEVYRDINEKDYAGGVIRALGIADSILLRVQRKDTLFFAEMHEGLNKLVTSFNPSANTKLPLSKPQAKYLRKLARCLEASPYRTYFPAIDRNDLKHVTRQIVRNGEDIVWLANHPGTVGSFRTSVSSFLATNRTNPLRPLTHDKIARYYTDAHTQYPVGKITKYLTFFHSIAKAETSTEVKDAIKKIAEPAGSYRVKRSSNFVLSLDAYPGIGGFLEFADNKPKVGYAGFSALAAPVGLSFSTSFKSKWSLTAHLSPVDLGGPLSYRFNNPTTATADTVSNAKDFRWESIVSPGAYVFVGFPKSPFAAGIGYNYHYNLRDAGDDYVGVSRLGIYFTMDLPLFILARSKN